MTEQSRTIAATVVGGIVGALAGYMFFTEGGRALRRRLEPAPTRTMGNGPGLRPGPYPPMAPGHGAR